MQTLTPAHSYTPTNVRGLDVHLTNASCLGCSHYQRTSRVDVRNVWARVGATVSSLLLLRGDVHCGMTMGGAIPSARYCLHVIKRIATVFRVEIWSSLNGRSSTDDSSEFDSRWVLERKSKQVVHRTHYPTLCCRKDTEQTPVCGAGIIGRMWPHNRFFRL